MSNGDPPTPRLFFDSGVIIEALLAPWSAARALLIFARSGAYKAIVAEDVRAEIEDNLTDLLATDPSLGSATIRTYARLLKLLHPESVGLTTAAEVIRNRHLIRHAADVPVLVAAMKAAPDWLITTNTRHFTAAVSARSRVPVCTPKQLIRRLQIAS